MLIYEYTKRPPRSGYVQVAFERNHPPGILILLDCCIWTATPLMVISTIELQGACVLRSQGDI